MDDLLREFLTESNESLAKLDVELVQFEQNPTDEGLLSNIFRLVHTIKGTCGFLGLPRLAAVAHASENVLGKIRDGELKVSPAAISTILESIDQIKMLLEVLEETEAEPSGDDGDLISRLNAIADGKEPIAAEPSSAPEPEAVTTAAAPTPGGSLFEQLGGEAAINIAVDIFYDKVTQDEKLLPFFQGVDIERLRGMQRAFLTMALGGENAYSGRDLRSAHAHLVAKGLNDNHFDRVMSALRQTLQELGVGEDLMIEVLTIAERTRKDVLGIGAPAQAAPAAAPEAKPAAKAPAKAAKAKPQPAPEPEAPQQETAAKESAIANQSIRVNVGLLENLMNLVSELVLTRNALLQMVRGKSDSELNVPLQRLSQTTSELQEGVMKTRMQPIGSAWNKLPRIVRDLALDLGKKIDLQMHGADTELDRQVLELIKDPLTHMVRNSGDHGLESTADRVAAGKPELGTITLNAYHEGGHIIIEVSDDGRGINIAKVKAKALKNGLASEAELESMPDHQVQQFIFKAGFSTAEAVTSVSGRGVGMDVVRTNIERIGGTIELKSVEGKGTTFIIKIPLTLAIVSALIVSCAGELFAVPQISVVELVRASDNSDHAIEQINGAPVLRLRESLLPLVSLRRLLGLKAESAEAATAEERESLILVTNVGSSTFGIVVDKVYDTEEIVVKPVAPILRDISLYSGNTILGDGSVVMILDPNGIAAKVGESRIAEGDAAELARGQAGHHDQRMALLVFRAHTPDPKAVPLSLVARLEEIDISKIERSGEKSVVQYRGQLMPLLTISPEARLKTEGRQAVVVFSDENHSMGLVVDEIVDIVEDVLNVELSGKKPGVLGSAVVDGKATEVIDAGYFVNMSQGERQGAARRDTSGFGLGDRNVLLVDDSPFFRNLLTPLLSVAGYKVTTVNSADAALEMLQEGASFDVIISDIEMPGMNGYDFAKTVRSDERWGKLPLVALSSHATPADMARGRQAGFDDYVAKFDRDAILNSLNETLLTSRGAA
jgi:two-component system chemotaxis sensor kinase CheA